MDHQCCEARWEKKLDSNTEGGAGGGVEGLGLRRKAGFSHINHGAVERGMKLSNAHSMLLKKMARNHCSSSENILRQYRLQEKVQRNMQGN